jgi:hypothetical protein
LPPEEKKERGTDVSLEFERLASVLFKKYKIPLPPEEKKERGTDVGQP